MLNQLLNQSVKFNSSIELTKKLGGVYALNEPSRDVWATQEAASHDFTVSMEPVSVNGREIPGRAIALDDQGKLLGNGVVGDGYQPCQPNELYGLADHLLSLDSTMTITDVVTSSDRGLIGIQMNKGEWSPTGEKFDNLQNNLLLLTTFDGTKPTSVRTISFRPYCSNQYSATKHMFSIRHTRQSQFRLAELKQLLTLATAQMDETNRQIQSLVDKVMSKRAAKKWFSDLLLNGRDMADLKGRAETTHQNKLSDFERLLRNGAGHEAGENTAYAAFNALTNYCTHERTTRVSSGADETETRWQSNLFGSAADFAQKGFAQLVNLK